MKVNVFLSFISLVAGGLIFFGFNSWGDSWLYSLGTSLVCFLLLMFATAVSLSNAPRRSVMLRTVSGIFFAALLLTDILLCKWAASSTVFIIVNAGTLCVWSAIAYGIAKAK